MHSLTIRDLNVIVTLRDSIGTYFSMFQTVDIVIHRLHVILMCYYPAKVINHQDFNNHNIPVVCRHQSDDIRMRNK